MGSFGFVYIYLGCIYLGTRLTNLHTLNIILIPYLLRCRYSVHGTTAVKTLEAETSTDNLRIRTDPWNHTATPPANLLLAYTRDLMTAPPRIGDGGHPASPAAAPICRFPAVAAGDFQLP